MYAIQCDKVWVSMKLLLEYVSESPVKKRLSL